MSRVRLSAKKYSYRFEVKDKGLYIAMFQKFVNDNRIATVWKTSNTIDNKFFYEIMVIYK